jgi:hypothetical protein
MGERRERVEGGKEKGKGVGEGEGKEGGKGGEERKGREEKGRDLIKCAVEKFSYFKAWVQKKAYQFKSHRQRVSASPNVWAVRLSIGKLKI